MPVGVRSFSMRGPLTPAKRDRMCNGDNRRKDLVGSATRAWMEAALPKR